MDFSYKHLTVLLNFPKNLMHWGRRKNNSVKVTSTVVSISTSEQCACGRLVLHLSTWAYIICEFWLAFVYSCGLFLFLCGISGSVKHSYKTDL